MSDYRDQEKLKDKRYAMLVVLFVVVSILFVGWYENHMPALNSDDLPPVYIANR